MGLTAKLYCPSGTHLAPMTGVLGRKDMVGDKSYAAYELFIY